MSSEDWTNMGENEEWEDWQQRTTGDDLGGKFVSFYSMLGMNIYKKFDENRENLEAPEDVVDKSGKSMSG